MWKWLIGLTATVALAQQPWWDNYPRILHFMNQPCDAARAVTAVALHADVAECSSASDPTVGIWGQRIGIYEESEPRALDKMHAAGLRTMAYFETFGQAKTFIVQLKRTAEGRWQKDAAEPQLTKRFNNHWSWSQYDGTGEVRWIGVHNYFDDEDYARPYTRTHPRYGSPPMRYPDGSIATGYTGDPADPRNSRIYDACGVKDIEGHLNFDYGPGNKFDGTFDLGKDPACPSWADYARASALQAVDFGTDSMYTDNFSPWDSFGLDPVHKAFGDWSVATFRDYLAKHFTRPQLKVLNIDDPRTFDVRTYLRGINQQFGSWNDARWVDDPIWRAYKIHCRQNGTEALTRYDRAVKGAAALAGKPDFPVTGNDFQDLNFGWARGNLDMINTEMTLGKTSFVPVFKRAREQARGRLGIAWFYVPRELSGDAAMADLLHYQGLANHILPEPWTGVRRPQTAGTDESTSEFFQFVGAARATFGRRTGVEEIGLYYSSSSELVHLTLDGWPGHTPPRHTQAFTEWGSLLARQHQQWRAVPEWKLTRETLAGLELLIIADAEVFDPADVPILQDWIAKGGRVIVSGVSGMRAGEKGNFERLATSSLEGVGDHIDGPNGFMYEGVVHAPAVPETVGITLYRDGDRTFVDINNTETLPIPPLQFDVKLDAHVLEQVLTPDGPGVVAHATPNRHGGVTVDIRGVRRYASIVLIAAPQKSPAAAARTRNP